MTYDYLIVGAGLTGAVLARELTDAGKTVMVIEKRDVIGGNCRDEVQDGIRYSLHGGHIFHTNSLRIWQYVHRFAEWQAYEHRVKVNYCGKIYSFPPNRLTLQQIGNPEPSVADTIMREMFFRGYSEKQWGRPLEEIPGHIIKRIPIRDNYDDRYFTDTYQGLPIEGYTTMIDRLLDGARVALGCDFLQNRELERQAEKIIYCGPIDELFDCDLGRLEYRSLHFKHTPLDDYRDGLGAPTINYTDSLTPYTREMDWRYWWRTDSKGTLLTTEYPQYYREGSEPYYPVETDANRELYKQYAARLDGHLIAAGRLGTYRYLNMDQAIGAALVMAEKLIKGNYDS